MRRKKEIKIVEMRRNEKENEDNKNENNRK